MLKLRDAREQARNAIVAAKAGRDPACERRAAKTLTVEIVVAEFIKGLEAQNCTANYVKHVQRTFDIHILPKWRGREIGKISRHDAIDLVYRVRDRGLPIAANKAFAALRQLFSWAMNQYDAIEANPIAGIKAPASETARERTMSNTEIRILWPALSELGYPFGHFLKLALVTGQRRTEVSGMRWCDVDEIAKTWTLPAELTKSHRTHIVPLSLLALEILADCRREAPKLREKLGPYVFTTTGDRPITGYSKVKIRLDQRIAELRKRARLENMVPWTIHDLRRTVGTGLGKLGVSRFHIARVLNHADASVTGIYDRHEYLAEKQDALEAWGAFMRLLALVPQDQLSQLDRLVQLISRDTIRLSAQAAVIDKLPALGELVEFAERDRAENKNELGRCLRELIGRDGTNVVPLRPQVAPATSEAGASAQSAIG